MLVKSKHITNTDLSAAFDIMHCQLQNWLNRN